jgi:hypothetical protein
VIKLKNNKIGVIALLLFGMVMVMTCIVNADTGVNATPETQSLGTVTTADVVGLVMETDAGTWTLTNDPLVLYTVSNTTPSEIYSPGYSKEEADVWQSVLEAAGGSLVTVPDLAYPGPGVIIIQISVPESLLNSQVPIMGGTWQALLSSLKSYGYDGPVITGNGIHTGALDPGQVQYTTAYDATIVAQGGHISFVKSMDLQTGNKIISQSNLVAKTGLAFAATSGGGNVVGSENLMLDGAGMNTTGSDKFLCPFAAGIASAIPAYCNIVQAGSKYDLTIGSVTTQADNAFVHGDATIPVVLNYNINVKPYGTTQGQVPASGSALGYIKAHIQEARGNGTGKAEDLVYSETSSVTGRITAFNKLMSYSSQVTSPAAGNHVIHASVVNPGAFGVDGYYTAFISPMGDIQVPDHTSITFTMGTHHIESDQFSTISGTADVYVDGVHAGELNSYTFQDVTSDHTIIARPGGA